MKEEIKKLIEEEIEKRGVRMEKQISSGGFLTMPTYDERTVHSIEALFELNSEGFRITDDIGAILLNAFVAE